jgi:hypothetical protein
VLRDRLIASARGCGPEASVMGKSLGFRPRSKFDSLAKAGRHWRFDCWIMDHVNVGVFWTTFSCVLFNLAWPPSGPSLLHSEGLEPRHYLKESWRDLILLHMAMLEHWLH